MVKKKSSSKTGFKVLKRHNQFKNPHVVLVGNGTLVNQAYNPIKGVKQVGEGIVGKAPLVKSKRFNNLQGKFVNVSPDQLNKIIISSGLHFKVKGNVLGMNEVGECKKRLKELNKIHSEKLSNCVKGTWFRQSRYGATFLAPGQI